MANPARLQQSKPRASARLRVLAPHGHLGASDRGRPPLASPTRDCASRPAAARRVASGSGLWQWGQWRVRLSGFGIMQLTLKLVGNAANDAANFATIPHTQFKGIRQIRRFFEYGDQFPHVSLFILSHHQSPYIHSMRQNRCSVNTNLQLFLEGRGD